MTLSAVLLAGGESRRMGIEKAQVSFEGEPLWQRQGRLLRQLGPDDIYLSVRNEAAWHPPKMKVILDAAPSRGPISGISATLTLMKTSHLLVLAVDMPFLLESDLRHLVSRARPGCGVVPTVSERMEPLAAIYPKESLPEFRLALSSDDKSMQKLVRRLAEFGIMELILLSPRDAERYRSVNRPEDLVARAFCR
jgi:molybdopterin-guanine dinucleotide biosynthesis protein A